MRNQIALGLLAWVLGFGTNFAATAETVPAASPAPPSSATPAGAKIVFETPVFDFGKVSSGEIVKHTFYFTNAGTEKLVISNVQPSCGCTAAGEWSKEVEPGKTGSIPIQFNSGSFGGAIAKSITVASNDKQQPMAYLQVRATIWKPIDVVPSYAVINVLPDSSQGSTKVTVTNNLDYPVYLWNPEINNASFTVQLSTNEPGKTYELTVATVAPIKPGTLQGQVSVKTSSTNTPLLQFSTWANVQPAISVLPPTVNLPSAPLTGPATPTVTVINNTTNALQLSKASVNVPGVDVQVRELQPGRYFSILLSFPKGFEPPADRAMEFSVVTSNPKFEVIKIPVHQAKAPAQPVASPAALPSPTPVPAKSSATTPAPNSSGPAAQVRHALPKSAPPPLPPSAATPAGKQSAGS